MECPHEKTDADLASALTCGHKRCKSWLCFTHNIHFGQKSKLPALWFCGRHWQSCTPDQDANLSCLLAVEEVAKRDALGKTEPINREIAVKWKVKPGTLAQMLKRLRGESLHAFPPNKLSASLHKAYCRQG